MVLLGLALMSCRANEPARADMPEFTLNQAFTLAGGQEGLIPSEKLRLRFAEVLEDSRCPTQVDCFWAGQARIAISVHPDGTVPRTWTSTPTPRRVRPWPARAARNLAPSV